MEILTAEQVKERIDTVPVYDVRGDDDYREEHIPGAKTAPLGSLETRIHDVHDTSSPVIVHCSNPECDLSRKAAERLESLGHTDVYRFKAGLEGWKDAGYDTVSS